MQPLRDHALPPDLEAYRRAGHPRGRVIVIAPTITTAAIALVSDINGECNKGDTFLIS